jgi:hypothetical protein
LVAVQLQQRAQRISTFANSFLETGFSGSILRCTVLEW